MAAAGTPNPRPVWLGILLLGDPAGSEHPCVSQHWEYFPLKFLLCLEAAAFCPRTCDHSTQLIQPLEKDFGQQKLKKEAHMGPGGLSVH